MGGAISGAMIDKAMGKKPTAKQEIVRVLRNGGWFAVHEMPIMGHNQNAIATAASILARQGVLQGRYRTGTKYKEWALTDSQLLLNNATD